MPTPQSTDTLIIGAGVIGTSIAYHLSKASIKPPLMTRAYAEAARKLGAQIYEHIEVTGFQHTSGKVTAIHTAQQETITCNRVVIATGAWSAHIGNWLGLTIPVFPARGQIL